MSLRPKTLGESIDEADIAALAWTIAVLEQKVIPFFELHIDCPIGFCPFADPQYILTNLHTAENLQALIDAFNEQRISEGKAPVQTFADGRMAEGNLFNA
jgi:hypothetical protein